MSAFARLACFLVFCSGLLTGQQPSPSPASDSAAAARLAGEWEIFIGDRGTGVVIDIAQSGNGLTGTYKVIPANNRYGIRPGFDFLRATLGAGSSGGSGSMTVRKGNIAEGPVTKEQAPFQFTLEEDGARMAFAVQSDKVRAAEREFLLVRKAGIKNVRLYVQGPGAAQPVTKVIEGVPMVIDLEMANATQRSVEVTIASGKTTLNLTARPAPADGSAGDAKPGHLRTEIFLPTFADQLGVAPAPKAEDAEPPGREAQSADWTHLQGIWKTVYKDAVLGNITGWAGINEYGRVQLRYQAPEDQGWKELKLRSARVLGEIPALPATSASEDQPAVAEQPALPKLHLVFDGVGVTSTPVKPLPEDQGRRFLLDAEIPAPIHIRAETVSAEVDLQRRDSPDYRTVTLELDAREPSGLLVWNWSYKADRGTARDAEGLGRAGVLLRMEGDGESSLGEMTGREAWLRQPPQIVTAMVLEDQLAIDPETSWEGQPQPKFRVGEKTRKVKMADGSTHEDVLGISGNLLRTVFIVARNLPPEDMGPPKLTIHASSGVQEYRIKARAEEGFSAGDIEKAWKQYRELRGAVAAAASGAASSAGESSEEASDPTSAEEGLLVQAILKPRAQPGPQSFTLAHAEGAWNLLYGDTTGQFSISRVLAESQGAEGGLPADAGEWEAVNPAFVPERLHLVVRVANPLPGIKEIESALGIQQRSKGLRDLQKVILKPDPNDPNLYHSPPIELVREADFERLKSQPGEAIVLPAVKGAVLRAQITADSGYAIAPSSVQADVETSPARLNALWKDAVKRAADLAGRPVEDWNEVARGEAGAATNFIVTDFVLNMPVSPHGKFLYALDTVTRYAEGSGIKVPMADWWKQHPQKNAPVRSLSVSIGDHAAMLLLRTEFIKMMREQVTDWQGHQNTDSMRRIYEAQKGAIEAKQSPLSFIRIPIKTLPGYREGGQSRLDRIYLFFKEEENPYLYQLFDTDTLRNKMRINESDQDFAHIQWEAFRFAFREWGPKMNKAIGDAQNTADADVLGLLKLAGNGFEPVIARLVPKLMKLADDETRASTQWVPDRVARAYVKSLAVLGEAVRAQEELSEIDTTVVVTAAALASVAFGNVSGIWSALATLSIGAADVGYAIYSDVYRNSLRKEDLEFEIGAGAVLGAGRAAETEDKILSGWQQALSVGGSFVGIGADAALVRNAMRAARAMPLSEVVGQASEIMKRIDVADPAALRQLSKADQAVLARYIENAEKMAVSGRAGDLTDEASNALANKHNIMEALESGTETAARRKRLVEQAEEAPPVVLKHSEIDKAAQKIDGLVADTEKQIEALKGAKPEPGSAAARQLDELKNKLGDLKQRRQVITTHQEPVIKVPDEVAKAVNGDIADLSSVAKARDHILKAKKGFSEGTPLNLAGAGRRLDELTAAADSSLTALRAAGNSPAAAAEITALTKRVADLKDAKNAVEEMNATIRKTTDVRLAANDVDLLKGERMELNDIDRALVEAAVVKSGGDWGNLSKKAAGSADDQLLMHKVAAYRRELVNKTADEVMADIEKITGKKLHRDAFGSTNLSSDYDVAIKGPGAELAIGEFNKRIRKVFGGRESGTVVDTNLYTDPVYNVYKSGDIVGTQGRVTREQLDASRQFLFQQMANAKYRTPEQWQAFRNSLLEGVPPHAREAMGDLLDQAQGAHQLAAGRKAKRFAEAGGDLDNIDPNLQLKVTNELYADTLSEIHNYRRFVEHLDEVKAGKAGLGSTPIPPALQNTDLGKTISKLDEMLGSKDPVSRQIAQDTLERLRGRAISNLRNKQGEALYYAAEAYQTRGTIAHVVGELQAKGIKVSAADIIAAKRRKTDLAPDDFVNSYYENGANLIKEFNAKHILDDAGNLAADVKPAYLEKAATKAAKYFVRQIDAANMGGANLAKSGIPDVEKLVKATVDLESARNSPTMFNDVLKGLGWSHGEYVQRVLAANRVLDSQVVRGASLMDFATNLRSAERAAEAVAVLQPGRPAWLPPRVPKLPHLDSGSENNRAQDEFAEQYENRLIELQQAAESGRMLTTAQQEERQRLLAIAAAQAQLDQAAIGARLAGLPPDRIDRALQSAPRRDADDPAVWRAQAAEAIREQTRGALHVPRTPPAPDAPAAVPPETRQALRLPDSIADANPEELARALQSRNQHTTHLSTPTPLDVLQSHLDGGRTMLARVDRPGGLGQSWVRIHRIHEGAVRADDAITGAALDYPEDVFAALSHQQSRVLVIDPYRTAAGQLQANATAAAAVLPSLDQIMPLAQ